MPERIVGRRVYGIPHPLCQLPNRKTSEFPRRRVFGLRPGDLSCPFFQVHFPEFTHTGHQPVTASGSRELREDSHVAAAFLVGDTMLSIGCRPYGEIRGVRTCESPPWTRLWRRRDRASRTRALRTSPLA